MVECEGRGEQESRKASKGTRERGANQGEKRGKQLFVLRLPLCIRSGYATEFCPKTALSGEALAFLLLYFLLDSSLAKDSAVDYALGPSSAIIFPSFVHTLS